MKEVRLTKRLPAMKGLAPHMTTTNTSDLISYFGLRKLRYQLSGYSQEVG